MADTKVSALTNATPVAGDKMYLSQTSGGPTDKSVLVSALKTFSQTLALNDQTADYTLVLADAGKLVRMNLTSTANTLTIPLNATEAFPVGAQILVEQLGTGATTIAATGGVTINRAGNTSLVLSGQYAFVALVKTATDTWQLTGMLTSTVPTVVSIAVDAPATALTTGDGKAIFRVPSTLNGKNLTGVAGHVCTVSSSGAPAIMIRNITDSQDMLSTALTIDESEKDSSTAATAAVINTTYDDVATGDEIAIDCDTAGTGTKGLIVELQFT